MKAKKKIALLRSPLGDIRAIRRRGEIFDNFSPPPPPPSFSSASFSILSMEYWTLNGEACFLPDGEDEGGSRLSGLGVMELITKTARWPFLFPYLKKGLETQSVFFLFSLKRLFFKKMYFLRLCGTDLY